MRTLPLARNARSNADNWPVEGRRRIIGDPDEVVSVLVSDGFSECKRELLRRRGGSRPLGGVWQGLNRVTGSVASVVWIRDGDSAGSVVYIEIDPAPRQG